VAGIVPVTLVLPGYNRLSTAPGLPDDGYDPVRLDGPLDYMFRPQQELYADTMNTGGPSPFDVFLSINASFTQGGNNAEFHGEALLSPDMPPAGTLQATGLLEPNDFQRVDHPGDPTRVHYRVVDDALLATFDVLAGVPFDATISVFMAMNAPHDPNAPFIAPTDMNFPPIVDNPPNIDDTGFSGYVGPKPAFGGGGAMIVLLESPVGTSISIVPEPSTMTLAYLGAAALVMVVLLRGPRVHAFRPTSGFRRHGADARRGAARRGLLRPIPPSAR
jgi:hypothetical protein